MDKLDAELDRLLRGAAKPAGSARAEAPFGFDTRVVALWRSQCSKVAEESWELASIFRRVAATALIVTAFASGGAYWQLKQNSELGEPLTNAYAIADTAIEAEVSP